MNKCLACDLKHEGSTFTPPVPVPLAEDKVEAEKIIYAAASRLGCELSNRLIKTLTDGFTTFAARVRAEQREADAKVCDDLSNDYRVKGGQWINALGVVRRVKRVLNGAAEAIRRGGK